MNKLMFQSDDYGFTEGVTLGILKGIKEGIVRNTGLVVNMPSSQMAAELIKDIPYVSVGIDINLVAGRPVSNPKDVLSLVNADGHFISSVQRKKENKVIGQEFMTTIFETDPYNLEETILETENQLLKFIELMGRKPEYFHPHSLLTPNTMKAAQIVAKKYDIPQTFSLAKDSRMVMIPCTWTPEPFPIEEQIMTNVEDNFIEALSKTKGDIGFFISHCGYVDADLLDETTYTMIRTRDLECAVSSKVKKYLVDNHIELVKFSDVKQGF